MNSSCIFIEKDSSGHRIGYGNPSISLKSEDNRNTYYNIYTNSWSCSINNATLIKHYNNAQFIEEVISSLNKVSIAGSI